MLKVCVRCEGKTYTFSDKNAGPTTYHILFAWLNKHASLTLATRHGGIFRRVYDRKSEGGMLALPEEKT